MGRAVVGGERVLVVGGGQPRRGEIWAFVDETGVLVVHRYRSQVDGMMWFCGDTNAVDDRPVPLCAVVGRVVEVDRNGRRRRVGVESRIVGRVRLDARSIRGMLLKVFRV